MSSPKSQPEPIFLKSRPISDSERFIKNVQQRQTTETSTPPNKKWMRRTIAEHVFVNLRTFFCFPLHYNNVFWRTRSPGGGGYSKKFYTGRLRPEVQPLTFYIPFFSEKAPLSYTFYWEKAPLLYAFLRRLMNKSLKQEVF